MVIKNGILMIYITEEVNDFIKEYDLPEWTEWREVHRILFRMRF